MKTIIQILSMMFFVFGCKTEKNNTEIKEVDNELVTNVSLSFLDEYLFPVNYEFKNTIIGGLSGIDYANNSYYLVVDDSKQPRIYKADIKIENQKIDTIIFKDLIKFDEKKYPFYATNHLDLESLIFNKDGFIVSSEGRTNSGANPTIFKIDTVGAFISSFQLPERFLANSPEKPRNNGIFEGLTRSFDKKGCWSGMEFPLTSDGIVPKYPTTNSPVRFTYYNLETNIPTKEFIYELSPLPRKDNGRVNLNGLTDVLEYKKDHFFVIERTYQSGYKGSENVVKIYEAAIDKTTTDVLQISSLKDAKYRPMKKKMLLDLNDIKHQLKENLIDNIEGITFGPKLPNGNRTLLLVSDDNFQKYGRQLNQFILLEILE